jgi:hypothetical protein
LYEDLNNVALLRVRNEVAQLRQQTMSVFDPVVSYPNIGFIGRGYDIVEANPDTTKGTDPGFRDNVLELTFDQRRFSGSLRFFAIRF